MSNPKVRKAKKEVIQAELQRLYREQSELKPSAVVEAARAADSPLHGEFEWNDKKAAHEHRLMQARQLIRVHFVVVQDEHGEDRRESYIHVPPATKKDGSEGAYHPVSVVVENVDWYARALTELLTKVRAATAAAEELQRAAQASEGTDAERMARITVALTALQTAGAAVQALH